MGRISMELLKVRNWERFLVILVVVMLIVSSGIYIHRAQSKACHQDLEIQYQCGNESLLLQKKLKQKQESFLEMESRWWSCSNTSNELNENLEEMKSQNNLLHSQLQELKGQNQDLAEKLRETEATLQMERRIKKPKETSSALSGPRTYSLLLGLGLAIAFLA